MQILIEISTKRILVTKPPPSVETAGMLPALSLAM